MSCAFPTYCPPNPFSHYVVRDFTVKTDSGKDVTSTFTYTSAITDRYGLGFLGFGQIVEESDGPGKPRIEKTYNPSLRQQGFYPFVGLPFATETTVEVNADTLVVSIQNVVPAILTSPYRVRDYVRLSSETTEAFEIDLQSGQSTLVQSTSANYEYDIFGNQTLAEYDEAGVKTRITSEYETIVDLNAWILNRPSSYLRERGESVDPFVASESNLSEFVWSGANLATRYLNFATPAEHTYVHTYDTYGNPLSTTETDAAGVWRTNSLEWDGGFFPTRIINALEQQTAFEYHSGFGVIVATTDADGRTTRQAVDGFGRVIERIEPDGTRTILERRLVDYQGVRRRGTGVWTSGGGGFFEVADMHGNPLLELYPVGDQNGRPVSRTYKYDVDGLLVAASLPTFEGDVNHTGFVGGSKV